MLTFLLAQAVVEHSLLSSISSGIDEATYRFQMFIEDFGVPHILIGLGIIVAVMLFWRR